MKISFYSKIAVENIKKNTRLYLPRILAEAGLLGCFYILLTLAMDQRLSEALGGSYLPTFMWMGAALLGILSFILILYCNSFLMKQRKSEYGLYNVLGMEKRHIVKVLFCESLFTSLLSYVLGVAFGVLFYKFSSLLICRLLQQQAVAGFYYLSAPTVLLPVLVFCGLDLVAFIINSIGIYRLDPVELLADKHTGEKEPRIRWVVLAIGLLSLGAGYTIALVTKSPLSAIFLFFAAVILVIIGTYCLFIAGATFVLKCLKKNKKYYYNSRHMPAVAGLLFRMKQNAVGLASIAILATGVLVMVSTTVSLYSGVQDTMETNYPRQLYLSAYRQEGETITHIPAAQLEKIVREAAEENGVTVEDTESERLLTVSYLLRDGKLLTKTEAQGGYDLSELCSVMFITEETYSELQSKKGTTDDPDRFRDPNRLGLAKDEIAFCRIASAAMDLGFMPDTLSFHGNTYRVKENLTYFPVNSNMSNVVNVFGIVVADDDVLNGIYLAQKDAYGEFASEFSDRIGVTFANEAAVSAVGEQVCRSVTEKLQAVGTGTLQYDLDTKWESLHNVLDMYGTFLFLGILLGFVCLFSTILIIYYKQISEGYEDRGRFQIMEKVGMDAREVRKTIGSQLILQFFLPLATAAVHTAVAFHILLKLLKILMLTNTQLFAVCSLITFAVFAAVYVAVYLLTAKTYYKIVH